MTDLPFAITLEVGSSQANKTGSWRTERPVYVRNQAPCGGACPAHEDPQAWLYHAEEGDYETAWRTVMKDNPFPALIGRVCYHPCETACNRAQLDSAVGINSVERFLGDEALRRGWQITAAPSTGRRVLIIGAGPCGLSAAYQLARLGHRVTVRDAAPAAGGMMRYGIPRYRLPRAVLDAEIQRIVDLGVIVETDVKVIDLAASMRQEGFDCVFLAVGAQLGRRAFIPAGTAAHMLDAVAMLRGMEDEERPRLGRRVVVYGGGNTALDAARTAKRLGAEDAIIVYRRTRERMPAHDSELQEALAEGVMTKWLSTIKRAEAGKLVVERMELDDDGFPQPTGELEELEADSLILALGQETDLSFLDGLPGVSAADGVVEVDERMMTGMPGVFAGGDMVPADRSVTVAIGHGSLAAANIHAWLHGQGAPASEDGPEAAYEGLNTWYYSDAPKTVRPELDAIRRSSTFDEVVGGLSADNALFEARRCLSCGSCFACDNCFGVCPDNAVIKLPEGGAYGYVIDLDFCKGCGLCAQECPCGAIEMVPEQI